MATFGEILAELRRDRHLTQREFANTIHVSVSTISNYEQGVHFPDIDKLNGDCGLFSNYDRLSAWPLPV